MKNIIKIPSFLQYYYVQGTDNLNDNSSSSLSLSSLFLISSLSVNLHIGE